jgi:hypothetical protein
VVGLAALVVLAVVGQLADRERQAASAPPPGAPTPTPVPPDARQVLTYYFYWYDSVSGGHLDEAGGMRHHPPPQPAPTWRSVEWHKRQFADMAYAGIDGALAVYWGFDRPEDEWSWRALPVMAQAWRERVAEGQSSPKIGLFFDTTILSNRDLTSAAGRAYFYENLKNFFSQLPSEAWVRVNGRPVVFLFTSDWVSAVDQSTFDYASDQFARDFGVRPYVVREVSWDYPILRRENGQPVQDRSRAIQTESSYLWAASIFGYVDRGGVAAVGPGYDDRLVPGRGGGRNTSREDGAFYARAFDAGIRSGKALIAIETWNEFHEGSGIAETVEYGRRYLDQTRELTARFRAAP